MSDSVWPQRRQPTRLPRPWDSPSKNTGVGCHFLLQCMKVKSESEVAQSCPTLSNPMDCNLPGSSVHGIFQARVLEWGAIAFSEERSLSAPFRKDRERESLRDARKQAEKASETERKEKHGCQKKCNLGVLTWFLEDSACILEYHSPLAFFCTTLSLNRALHGAWD